MAARGGPDGGGWVWVDSREPEVDTGIETPGALATVASPTPDDAVYAVNLSFPFTLYGVTSNTVYISTNGWISLQNPGAGPAASFPANRALPSGGNPNAAIYYLWDDLDAGGFIQEGATANGHLILVRHFMKGSGALFQAWIQFYVDGSVKVVYVVGPDVASATIGIEDGTSTDFTQIAHDGMTAPDVTLGGNYAILYYPAAAPDCGSATPITCGGNVAGSTLAGVDDVQRYGCSGFDYSGTEAIYSLDLTGLTQLDVSLSGLGLRDQDVMILRDQCDGTLGCVAGGADNLSVPMLGAGRYYIAVDGKTPADDGAHDVAVVCNDISQPISCNSGLSDNISGPSGIDTWGCQVGDYAGAERIYSFTIATEQTVMAQLTPAAPFDLIIADQATMTPLTSPCMSSADSDLAILRLQPGSYAVIVDGPTGATGGFSLQLDCTDQIPAVPIDCGDVNVPGSNVGTSMIDWHTSCGAGFYGMGEEYYRFRPSLRVIATATQTSPTHELFAFRESGIPDSCAGTAATSLRLANLGLEDHLFVLDSATAQGPVNLSLSCAAMTTTPLACDTTIPGVTSASGNLARYSCLPGNLDGGEQYFLFDNPVAQSFAVGVSSAADLDIAVFDGPFNADAAECPQGGDRVARWDTAPPGEYLIVVDGAAGTEGSPFDLTITCGASALSCGAAPAIGCNSVTAGDTATGTNTAAIYGLADDLFTGPELVYSFTQPGPGPSPVSFLLQNASDARLDILLVDACDPSAVLASGDDSIIMPSLDPGTYYVVVDGRDGASGTFELVSFCGGPFLDPPVLNRTLRPGECYTETKRLYFPPSVPIADVMFSFDLSGSMGDELNQAKANTSDIYTALNGLIPSLHFGIASFVEYATAYTDTTCNISHIPSAPTPYPFLIHQALTPSILAVDTALQNMSLIGGAKETYTRTFWESYTNPNIGWRECARKLWLSFGDEPPMDCNAYECIGGTLNTGRDPGDGFITGDANDILLLPTIDTMAANGIVLIPVDSSEDPTLVSMWECLAARTGGAAFVTDQQGRIEDGTSIVDGLVGVILDAIRPCPEVRLDATGPNAGWVTITPDNYSNVLTPFYGEFEIEFCVPPGTPPGTYQAPVEARCVGGGSCSTELLGTQEVVIDVPEACPIDPIAAVDTPTDVCVGETVTLDGSASSDCGGGGLRYRWLDDAGVEVCGWDTTATCDVTPPVGTTTYTLEVECADALGCVSSVDVEVTVIPEPIPALAPAGPLCLSESFDLAADGSDPQGCPVPLEYRFREAATVLRDWSPSSILTGVTPAGTTTYTVDVRCTVDPGCSASTDITVEVVPPPIADPGPGDDVCEGIAVTLDASSSGDPGCPGGLEYRWLDSGVEVRGWGVPTYDPPTMTAGSTTYTVEVRCAGLPTCLDAADVIVVVRLCSLAVHFDHYEATPQEDGTIAVTWGTLLEDGTRAFSVERAAGAAGPFSEIGRVRAHGAGLPYRFVDDMPGPGARPWYKLIEHTTAGRGDQTPPFQNESPDTGDDERNKAGGGRTRTRMMR